MTTPQVKTPVGSAPVIPLLLIGFGGYLLWFGVKYFRGTGPAVWPSYPVKSVLQGKGLPPPNPAPAAADQVTLLEAPAPVPGASTTPPAASAGGSAQNTARLLLPRYGWSPGEMQALGELWTGESGWNPRAQNPSSGALGIAQALGHGVPGSQGSLGNEYGPEYGLTLADAQAANSGNALQQIRWGMGYIKARYGSPSAALAAWNARTPHWY